MKKILAAIVGMLFLASAALAISVPNVGIDLQQTGLMTAVSPTQTYTKTFTLNTLGISFDSCNDPQYYEAGSCDYVWKCYVIMEESCDSLECAEDYWCEEVDQLTTVETVTVNYDADVSNIGKTFGVAAFVMHIHRDYDWYTQAWSEEPAVYESTLVSDTIEVQGAPQPPASNPSILGQVISDIVSAIQQWFCAHLGWWC